MATEIVTKRGDNGRTDRASGERISKNSPVIEAVGALDELNASLGLAKAWVNQAPANRDTEAAALSIGHIQRQLFVVAADVSMASKSVRERNERQLLSEDMVRKLEERCHHMEETLELTDFVVFGKTLASAHVDMARAICRRAERRALACKGPNRKLICRYLNRLSDFLFLLARRLEGKPEYR